MSTIENLNTFDPFADTGENVADKLKDYIHIRIQQRNGRKTVTTVQGLPDQYDLKKILKQLKKEFACNGFVAKDPDNNEVLQLQGDQRANALKFLVEQLGIKRDKIKIHGF